MAEITARAEAIGKVAGMLRGIRVAMLTTTTSRGWLRSRPMVTQQVDFDGDLWFFTSRKGAKAADVRDRRQVNVSYVSPSDHRYVSVSGIATIVDDREKAAGLWNEAYRAWFPRGLEDPDLALIRVQAEEAEYWDQAENRMVLVPNLLEMEPAFHDMEPGAGI